MRFLASAWRLRLLTNLKYRLYSGIYLDRLPIFHRGFVFVLPHTFDCRFDKYLWTRGILYVFYASIDTNQDVEHHSS